MSPTSSRGHVRLDSGVLRCCREDDFAPEVESTAIILATVDDMENKDRSRHQQSTVFREQKKMPEEFIDKDKGVLKDCLVREACQERAEGGTVVCLGRNSSKESIPRAEEGCSLVYTIVPVSCRTSFVAETQGEIGTSTEGLEFKNSDGLAQFNVTESPQGWTLGPNLLLGLLHLVV